MMRLEPVLLAIPLSDPARSPQQTQRQRDYSRLALRECAKSCGAPLEGWEKDRNQAPVRLGKFYWSVSHKRQWTAAVIADRPVGIDVEKISPRRTTLYEALACDSEWDLTGGRSWNAFFRVWTAKEATLKANGVGITGFSDCKVRVVEDRHHMTLEFGGHTWPIEHHYHDGHVAAVTCVGTDVQWRVLDGVS